MRILMVTPEANPFAQSGGLAEVIYGLAWTLTKLGHEVRVVLPLYRQVRESAGVARLPRDALAIVERRVGFPARSRPPVGQRTLWPLHTPSRRTSR